jgi:hypothetical protein
MCCVRMRALSFAALQHRQKGIDLHWWCHAAIRWNTPASPVDYEQREGRAQRYGGHAVRTNLATAFG